MNKEHVGDQNDKTPPVYNVMEGVTQKTDSDGRMSCEGGKKRNNQEKRNNRYKKLLLSGLYGNRNVPLCQWCLTANSVEVEGKTIPSAQDVPNHWQALLYWPNSS